MMTMMTILKLKMKMRRLARKKKEKERFLSKKTITLPKSLQVQLLLRTLALATL